MSRNRLVPAVRQWMVTTQGGETWIVWAPSRVLARLNFRAVCWEPIERGPSPVRKDYGSPPIPELAKRVQA